jgi:hypothetical protein
MPNEEPRGAAEDGAGAAPASRRGASARAEPGSAAPPRDALEEEILAHEWRLEAQRDQIEDLRSALAARDAPGAAEAGEARAAAAMFVDIEELRRAARAAGAEASAEAAERRGYKASPGYADVLAELGRLRAEVAGMHEMLVRRDREAAVMRAQLTANAEAGAGAAESRVTVATGAVCEAHGRAAAAGAAAAALGGRLADAERRLAEAGGAAAEAEAAGGAMAAELAEARVEAASAAAAGAKEAVALHAEAEALAAQLAVARGASA